MSIHFKFNELYGVLFCWVQVFHGWNLDVIDLIEKNSLKIEERIFLIFQYYAFWSLAWLVEI